MSKKDDNEFEVEEILDSRFDKEANKEFFLVKWLNYPIQEATWEPAKNFKHLKEILADFVKKQHYKRDNNINSQSRSNKKQEEEEEDKRIKERKEKKSFFLKKEKQHTTNKESKQPKKKESVDKIKAKEITNLTQPERDIFDLRDDDPLREDYVFAEPGRLMKEAIRSGELRRKIKKWDLSEKYKNDESSYDSQKEINEIMINSKEIMGNTKTPITSKKKVNANISVAKPLPGNILCDVPDKILSLKVEDKDLELYIQWKPRINGETPESSYVTTSEYKKYYNTNVLCEFYEQLLISSSK